MFHDEYAERTDVSASDQNGTFQPQGQSRGDAEVTVSADDVSAEGIRHMDNPIGSAPAVRSAAARAVPHPVLDEREMRELDELAERFAKLEQPGALAKLGNKLGSVVPDRVRDAADGIAESVQAQKLYAQAMDVIAAGFKIIEEQAARLSTSPDAVIARVNGLLDNGAASGCPPVSSLDELCLLRSYDVAKVANAQKPRHLGLAFVEGAATGAPGFAGIPFNLVLSMFLYYRAVQSIALHYGFDTRNNPEELVIAGGVFANAMAPGQGRADGMAGTIGKIMMISEAEVVRQTVKKGWSAMAERGGIPLLIAQMRALANNAARKAVARAGQEGLENSVFRGVFEQIGKRLGQKAVGRAVPLVGGAIGALFDTGQMSAVIEYADLFYHKRFILEKAERIERLTGGAVEDGDVEDPPGA